MTLEFHCKEPFLDMEIYIREIPNPLEKLPSTVYHSPVETCLLRHELWLVSRKFAGFMHCFTVLYMTYLSFEECLTLGHQMNRRFFLNLCVHVCCVVFWYGFFLFFATAARATESHKVGLSDGMYFVEEKRSMPVQLILTLHISLSFWLCHTTQSLLVSVMFSQRYLPFSQCYCT